MVWFNLPSQCVFDKEIPIHSLLNKLGNRNKALNNLISSSVESFRIFACLNDSTYSINCPKQNDSYLNEILFIQVKLMNIINIELLTINILKAFKYQTVIIFQYGEEYCFAAGLVRDAKIIIENRKIDSHCISQWLNSEDIMKNNMFDIEKLNGTSYESIYASIYETIRQIGEDRYIPLTFVAALYAYTRGIDAKGNWSVYIELQKTIKERYPNNRIKSKFGVESYRFSEDEVYDLLIYDGGYVNGDDLIETLCNFCEFEDDFDLQLPTRLRDRVDDYEADFYNSIEKIVSEGVQELDYHDW